MARAVARVKGGRGPRRRYDAIYRAGTGGPWHARQGRCGHACSGRTWLEFGPSSRWETRLTGRAHTAGREKRGAGLGRKRGRWARHRADGGDWVRKRKRKREREKKEGLGWAKSSEGKKKNSLIMSKQFNSNLNSKNSNSN